MTPYLLGCHPDVFPIFRVLYRLDMAICVKFRTAGFREEMNGKCLHLPDISSGIPLDESNTAKNTQYFELVLNYHRFEMYAVFKVHLYILNSFHC